MSELPPTRTRRPPERPDAIRQRHCVGTTVYALGRRAEGEAAAPCAPARALEQSVRGRRQSGWLPAFAFCGEHATREPRWTPS